MSHNGFNTKKCERFLDHLKRFGLLSSSGHASLLYKTSIQDETALIFSLSELLQTSSASDFYDLSRRMYDAWVALDRQSENHSTALPQSEETNLKQLNAHLNSENEAIETNNQHNIQQSSSADQQLKSSSNGIALKAENNHNDQRLQYNGTEEQINNSPLPEKYPSRPDTGYQQRLNEKELELKAQHNLMLFNLGFDKLGSLLQRRDFRVFRSLITKKLADSRNYARASRLANNNTQQTQSPQKRSGNNGIPAHEERGRSQQRRSRNESVEVASPPIQREENPNMYKSDTEASNLRFNKLYEDKFLQEQNKMLRRELHDLVLMRDHTFSPKINFSKDQTSENGNGTVFDRLAKRKTPKATSVHRSIEVREMDGVTFAPDLKKSQAVHVNQADTDQTNEKKSKAADRLYQDAELKQRVLKMKIEYIREQELKDCTFAPKLTSPKNRKRQQREGENSSRSPAGERLYQDSMARKQAQIIKLAEKEQTHNQQYTFKPQIFTKRI